MMRRGQNHSEVDDKLRNRNNWMLWGIAGSFSLVIIWKIAVTPFDMNLSVLLTFLLALFSMGIALLFYRKTSQMLDDVRQLLAGDTEKNNEHTLTTEESATMQHDSLYMDEQELEDTSAQIEAEEKTLKLKEAERKELLERLLQQTDMDESEKQTYITKIEKVDHDLFNLRANLHHLRKKMNHSLQEVFILEKTKQVREVVDLLGPEFLLEAQITAINERFQALKDQLPESVIAFLRDNHYIDDNDNMNRKGYRQFLKEARKLVE